MPIKSVKEKTNFTKIINIIFTSRKAQYFKISTMKIFNAFFPFVKYKYGIESVQLFFFGFYKKDGKNARFYKKKCRKKKIQSIRNVNAYPTKSNDQV